jgi:tetratricopeptide (TPR) repeat protein
VTIRREDASGNYKVNSGKDGKYIYDGLPAGQYILGVIYNGDFGLLRPAELRNGRVLVSDFDLTNWDPMGKADSLDKLRDLKDDDVAPEEDNSKLTREQLEFYEKAKDAMARKDYATAISILKELVAKEPGSKHPPFWNKLGESYLMAKKYDDAVAAYRQAVALMPDSASFNGMLAMALLYADKIDEATVYTEKTAALEKGKGALAYYNLGLALIDKGDAQKAEKSLETAITLDPGYGDAFYQLGLTYLSTRPSSNPAAPNVDAVVPLKRFISLSPKSFKEADLAKDEDLKALSETVAIAHALITEVCKPPAAARLDNCKK